MRKLLIIGVDNSHHAYYRHLLGRKFHLEFKNQPNLVKKIRTYSVAIIIPQYNPLDCQFIQLCHEVMLPCVVVTSQAQLSHGLALLKAGAFDMLVHPFNNEVLVNIIQVASLAHGLDQMHADSVIDRFKGESESACKLKELVLKVASSSLPVLIEGESGTGKEVLARMIHDLSALRREYSFIPRNCSAIPFSLFESEMLGVEKGAFTDARNRIGFFALAHKGTLFLDEIGDLPKSCQPKLLRILETGEFSPLGSTSQQSCNVRLVSASNKTINKRVKKGKFRKDLYYRISALKIKVPPLRERLDDIPHLLKYFLSQQEVRRVISNGAINKLLDYDWPGNVRELKNVIYRAHVLASNKGPIRPENILFNV